jgi:CRP/FNR family transcriptional regulator, cyclic AMP receptor protein
MDAAELASVPLFAGLSKHERRQVAQWADEIDVGPGKHLVDQGKFPYEFFVIREGTAEVTKDGDHLRDLGPGDFFGEIALMEGERRTASVVATSSMRVIVMHAREFHTLASELPNVAERLRQAIRERA